MNWFADTGIAQQTTSKAKLPILSKILKGMVAKWLALLLFNNIRPFTNLLHFLESVY